MVRRGAALAADPCSADMVWGEMASLAGVLVATRPRTIDEYLAGVDAESCAALQKVRRAIHAAAPKAEECISYGMPAFRLNGKSLVAELAGYDTGPGTIRFSGRAALPATLVRKLVEARIGELAE